MIVFFLRFHGNTLTLNQTDMFLLYIAKVLLFDPPFAIKHYKQRDMSQRMCSIQKPTVFSFIITCWFLKFVYRTQFLNYSDIASHHVNINLTFNVAFSWVYAEIERGSCSSHIMFYGRTFYSKFISIHLQNCCASTILPLTRTQYSYYQSMLATIRPQQNCDYEYDQYCW